MWRFAHPLQRQRCLQGRHNISFFDEEQAIQSILLLLAVMPMSLEISFDAESATDETPESSLARADAVLASTLVGADASNALDSSSSARSTL